MVLIGETLIYITVTGLGFYFTKTAYICCLRSILRTRNNSRTELLEPILGSQAPESSVNYVNYSSGDDNFSLFDPFAMERWDNLYAISQIDSDPNESDSIDLETGSNGSIEDNNITRDYSSFDYSDETLQFYSQKNYYYDKIKSDLYDSHG